MLVLEKRGPENDPPTLWEIQWIGGKIGSTLLDPHLLGNTQETGENP